VRIVAKIKLSKNDIKYYQSYEEGRVYLEYNEKIGGEYLGLTMPYGYPPGVDEMGGVINVYNECIRRGVTWQEFLGVKPVPDDVII
jgi:hypothetical protein